MLFQRHARCIINILTQAYINMTKCSIGKDQQSALSSPRHSPIQSGEHAHGECGPDWRHGLPGSLLSEVEGTADDCRFIMRQLSTLTSL